MSAFAAFGTPKIIIIIIIVDRDSSVGIATRYGLDGPGIESRWGWHFSAPIRTGPGAHPAFCTMRTGSFLGGKAAGAWRWPPTPYSAEVKERVGLHLYSTSGPSWPVLGRTLPLLIIIIIIITVVIICVTAVQEHGTVLH